MVQTMLLATAAQEGYGHGQSALTKSILHCAQCADACLLISPSVVNLSAVHGPMPRALTHEQCDYAAHHVTLPVARATPTAHVIPPIAAASASKPVLPHATTHKDQSLAHKRRPRMRHLQAPRHTFAQTTAPAMPDRHPLNRPYLARHTALANHLMDAAANQTVSHL